MSIGSLGSSLPEFPATAAQQKADLEGVTGQYDRRLAAGTAESTAATAARSAQTDAASHGVTVTLSSAARTANTVAAQALSQSGATFSPGALVTPGDIGAQKADLGIAASEYRHLAGQGALEAGVASFRPALVSVVG